MLLPRKPTPLYAVLLFAAVTSSSAIPQPGGTSSSPAELENAHIKAGGILRRGLQTILTTILPHDSRGSKDRAADQAYIQCPDMLLPSIHSAESDRLEDTTLPLPLPPLACVNRTGQPPPAPAPAPEPIDAYSVDDSNANESEDPSHPQTRIKAKAKAITNLFHRTDQILSMLSSGIDDDGSRSFECRQAADELIEQLDGLRAAMGDAIRSKPGPLDGGEYVESAMRALGAQVDLMERLLLVEDGDEDGDGSVEL